MLMVRNIRYLLMIAILLCVAHLPVLLSTYIRQDDMAWQLWQGMQASERFDYYNVLVHLFRPVSWPFILLTDKLSFNTHGAVYARLINIVFILISASLLYIWQKKFTKNDLLACVFSISVFTLPPFQVFSATANYLHMLFTLLVTIVAVMIIWTGISQPNRKLSLLFGFLLYLVGLMDYALASMFAWVMLVIAYLYELSNQNIVFQKNNQIYLLRIAGVLIFSQVLYFILGKIVQSLVVLEQLNSPRMAINFQLWASLKFFFSTLIWHSHFWFWRKADVSSLMQLSELGPFFIILALFLAALWHTRQKIMLPVIVLVAAQVLAYLPIVLSSVSNVNFRYAVATMPLLLFVIYWSVWQFFMLINNKVIIKIIGILIIIFSVAICNRYLQWYIVGPQTHDLAYIRAQIEQRILPILKQNSPVTVAVKCYVGSALFHEYNAPNFEYGMRMWQYSGQCISAVVHSLRYFDVETTRGHANKDYFTADAEVAIVPWGILMAVKDTFTNNQIEILAKKYANYPVIIITSP